MGLGGKRGQKHTSAFRRCSAHLLGNQVASLPQAYLIASVFSKEDAYICLPRRGRIDGTAIHLVPRGFHVNLPLLSPTLPLQFANCNGHYKFVI
jgi:hypothetical protein